VHAEADQWISRYSSMQPLQVLEIGSLNINGSAASPLPERPLAGHRQAARPGR